MLIVNDKLCNSVTYLKISSGVEHSWNGITEIGSGQCNKHLSYMEENID